jgi:hypothetical protein
MTMFGMKVCGSWSSLTVEELEGGAWVADDERYVREAVHG